VVALPVRPLIFDVSLTDMGAMLMSPAAAPITWALWLERGTCVAAVLWLQVVGVVTHSIIHHVVHALPLLLLVPLRRSRSVALTAALASFVWVFMLAAISPMVHYSLVRGYLVTRPEVPYTWLAPSMCVICAIWCAVALTISSGKSHRFKWYVSGGLLLIPTFAALHPWATLPFEGPLDHVLRGAYLWATILVVELPLVLVGPWLVALWVSGARDIRITTSNALWQVTYWAFFLLCMVAGLLPALNR